MKKLFYVVIGIGALYIILAFFGKPKIKVERQIIINKSSDIIKSKLGDLKFFHDKWSPWTEKDTAMITNYTGEPGKVGHKMDWKGNKTVGTGTMEIISFSGDSLIEKLSLDGRGNSKAYYIVSGKDNSTNITWGLEMQIGFFGRPIMMFMNMDKMLGGDFENGLAKLKKVMEEMKEEVVVNYEIKEIEWPETNLIGSKKETVPFEKLEQYFGTHFSVIAEELEKNKIQPEGPPLGIYWLFDTANQSTEVAAAFKVAKGIKVKGYINYCPPESKVLQLSYYGDYQKMWGAYDAMDAFMKKKNASKVLSIEEYVTDPMSEKDTAKWLTNIYYILK